MDGSKRVTPDMCLEYRMRHKFQGPHCLCPLLRTTDKELPFTEAKILLKDSGDHIGEYFAECPNGRCEYLRQYSVLFQDKESVTRQKFLVSLEQTLMNRGALCAPKDAFPFIFAFTKL